MDNKEFKKIRKRLNRTQKEIAQLLCVSKKAVHSYEQGWRNIPPYVERQMIFLLSRMNETLKDQKSCWEVKKCPPTIKKHCPAWEFHTGELCWFINGSTLCGYELKDWKQKMESCRSCEILKSFL